MFSTNENIFSSPYGFIAVPLYTPATACSGVAWALATRMSLLLLLFRGCLPQLQVNARGRVCIPSRWTELYIVTITDSQQRGTHQLARQVVLQLISKLWAAHRTNCSRESSLCLGQGMSEEAVSGTFSLKLLFHSVRQSFHLIPIYYMFGILLRRVLVSSRDAASNEAPRNVVAGVNIRLSGAGGHQIEFPSQTCVDEIYKIDRQVIRLNVLWKCDSKEEDWWSN